MNRLDCDHSTVDACTDNDDTTTDLIISTFITEVRVCRHIKEDGTVYKKFATRIQKQSLNSFLA